MSVKLLDTLNFKYRIFLMENINNELILTTIFHLSLTTLKYISLTIGF